MKRNVIIVAMLSLAIGGCTKSGGTSPSSSGTGCVCVIGWGGGVSGTPHVDSTVTYGGEDASQCQAQQMSLAHTYGLSSASNGYNGVSCSLK